MNAVYILPLHEVHLYIFIGDKIWRDQILCLVEGSF